jgi:protein TonB
MSYVDQGMTPGRVWAIIMVAILHALLGYAFVTGLAYKFVKNVQEDLKTFDVQEAPPPEEEPPPPPDTPQPPPPVTTPPPMQRFENLSPPPVAAPPPPPVPAPYVPPAPPAPPAPPPPPRTVEPARARANLASYVSNDDYPASALRNEEQGTTGFRLTVGPDGRVTNCVVTSSSGSSALDAATCRIMRSRARFTPARDNTGSSTTDTVNHRITWRIQG